MSRINDISIKFLFFLLKSLTIYVIVSFSIVVYLFGKYYFIDIKTIEPTHYVPDVKGYEEYWRDKYIMTSFNRYYSHLNIFGSRNLFEISNDDENIVVLLGDSHFFGHGLNDNETISYFLNLIDTKRKYINLALPNLNIHDSVARYFLKCKSIKPPILVIFQIELQNDICASLYIEDKIREAVENDYRYVLLPFRMIFSKNKLYHYYLSRIYRKIYQDLSEKRFVEYIIVPLNKLRVKISKSGTKMMIISYKIPSRLKNYNKRLENYCLENNIYFFRPEDLLDKKYMNDRLPNGHSSANFNRVLANQIKNKIDELNLN